MICLRIRLDMRIWQCCKKNERASTGLFGKAHSLKEGSTLPTHSGLTAHL